MIGKKTKDSWSPNTNQYVFIYKLLSFPMMDKRRVLNKKSRLDGDWWLLCVLVQWFLV